MENKEILIVGAGPSGLSMAIFLNALGYPIQIIDKKKAISPYSKALGVNPRTLEIFEPFGITERFLQKGRIMRAINIWKGDQHILRNDFQKVKHKYPFMLIQGQKASEEILLEELQKRKITVAYDTELIDLKHENGQALAIGQYQGEKKLIPYDYLIGADGGNSQVRSRSNVAYEGHRYEETWQLYDVALETPVNRDEGHVRLFSEGGLLMIRLENEIWRVAGRMPALLNYLPKGTKVGTIRWESTFKIHHKVAAQLSWGNTAIIGDAAHLHSPVGARGMNLGIEDAYILANLFHQGQWHRFEALRKPYLQRTVNTINRLTMGLAGDSAPAKTIRKHIGILKYLAPLLLPRTRKFILGLNK